LLPDAEQIRDRLAVVAREYRVLRAVLRALMRPVPVAEDGPRTEDDRTKS
jgi:hypothetical protein